MGGEPETVQQWVRGNTSWRRRRYIVEDDLIQPAGVSAPVAYDPFGHYAALGTPGPSLYLDLVNLDAANPRAVEEFASSWGLLGLFQHRLVQVRSQALPPGQDATDMGLRALVPVIVRPSTNLLVAGRAVNWMGSGHLAQTATVVDEDGEEAEEPLEDYARPFFPSLFRAESPEPLSQRLLKTIHTNSLWDHLSEPIEVFQTAARRFRQAYEQCSRWREGPRSAAYVVELQKAIDLPRLQVRQVLAYLPSRVSGPPDTEPGDFQEGTIFPSLLSACYEMLKKDLISKRYLRFCANEKCQKGFVGDRSDQFYCTKHCANAQKQREHRRHVREREQQREHRRLASEGEPRART